MNRTIQVNIKNVYGRELIYPANPLARTHCMIAGTKTMSPKLISILKELGHPIEVVTPVLV